MAKKPTVYEFIPKLGQLRDDVLFGDVWEHKDLSKRDRSLATVAILAALYRTDEMRGHMKRALENGVTETELKGLITHVAFYAGWPCAVNAGRIAIEVCGEALTGRGGFEKTACMRGDGSFNSQGLVE
jgi:4-carboxymuconolactone decarboxylase